MTDAAAFAADAVPKQLSVGVIGAGQIVADAHLPVLLATAGARVEWILDRDVQLARRIAKSAGARAVDAHVMDVEGQLPHADVVLLAIPYGARQPYYDALHQLGAAVYVEKPFAAGVAEHRARVMTFGASRVACGFQRRSMGTSAALREVVRSKPFGRLESVRIEFGSPATRTGSYQSNLALAGGGLLLDVGLHSLDLALFAVDAVRASAASVEMIRDDGFDIHTTARLHVGQRNGEEIDVELLCTSLGFTQGCNVYRFEHADVTHDMWRGGSLIVAPKDSPLSFRMSGDTIELPQTSNQIFHRHWTTFFDAVRSGAPNYTCASETELTTAIAEMLYAAGR